MPVSVGEMAVAARFQGDPSTAPTQERTVGNEAADAVAKEAAQGESSPCDRLPKELRKTLPLSTTRARGTFKAELDRRAADQWRASEHG